MNAKDLASVYDTIMSIPGMNEQVKVDLKISRKNALLLHQAIRRAVNQPATDSNPDLIDIATAESKQELMKISEEFLQRTNLMELNEKILRL
ncbi:hypothetical protein DYBT9275_04685 [Dyadobacter sp. CECT 9275]|uniref:Uncharacterized protein n=1 Tax=Dyadobacter helix TaxID=2822344 RepID=A0A916JH05_9BACT|nr:hypothetical protein [Dyadobacter sp. CECT 9275]CAG5010295.1 hypothetical protein DYBT9275_04685 [Dyadobacter sp. CECT 9275]